MLCVIAALIAGCDQLPGKPKESDRPLNPSQVKDFAALYGENCSGCHGPDGKFGAAYELANPVYQALVDDDTLTRIVGEGIAGTAMPPSVHSAGGYLTPDQVAIVVSGMRQRWKTGGPLERNAALRERGIRRSESRRRSLRPLLRALPRRRRQGRSQGAGLDRRRVLPDAGQQPGLAHAGDRRAAPTWAIPIGANYPGGQPLTAQQVSDVVAWLAAKRPQFAPGNYARNP